MDIPTENKEIVEKHEGVFVRLGDYAALAWAVQEGRGFQQSSLVSRTTRIRERFSAEAMWARYEPILKELLAAPAAVRPRAGQLPQTYRPRLRLFKGSHWMRVTIGWVIAKSPTLANLLANLRGI